MNKRYLFIIFTVCIAVAALAVYLVYRLSSQKVDSSIVKWSSATQTSIPNWQPTNQDFINTYQEAMPSLVDSSGQLKFGVLAVSQPLAGWYVVTMNVAGTDDHPKVVFNRSGTSVILVYNPLQSPLSQLLPLPKQVQDAAQ